MYAVLDRPLVYTLYTSIKDEIEWMIRNKGNKGFPWGKSLNLDSVFKLILQNNGCQLSDDPVYHEFTLKPDELNYKIIFMYGAIGNKVNECFDYIEFFGAKTLVIFMDKFLDIDSKLETEDEIFMGKSIYINMIRIIADIFIATTTNFAELNSSILSTTAAGNAYRFAGIFIAAKLVEPFCYNGEISENDISIIDPKELNNMLHNIPFELLLSGVKYMS